MKKCALILAAMAAPAAAFAGLYGDTPDAKHAWAVHDRNRPNPVKISAEPGRPPSDAIVLFRLMQLSFSTERKNRSRRTGAIPTGRLRSGYATAKASSTANRAGSTAASSARAANTATASCTLNTGTTPTSKTIPPVRRCAAIPACFSWANMKSRFSIPMRPILQKIPIPTRTTATVRPVQSTVRILPPSIPAALPGFSTPTI